MATKTNIQIDQGTSFRTTLDIVDNDGTEIPLEGYTGSAQIRKHYTSLTAVSFDVEIIEEEGKIRLSLDPDVSAEMEPGRYVYDVYVTSPDGDVSRIVEGLVTINPQVTR